MTIRNSLLALLADEPAHGYGLKSRFETTTGEVWRLNVGQVYTTLRRLQRDALIEPLEQDSETPSWRLTAAGRDALTEWFSEPVAFDPPARDELALKVLLAVSTAEVDALEVLRTQRTETMKRLQGYTATKRDADPRRQLPWCLLLDSLILKTKAELEWLDRCEEAVRQGER